MTKKHIVLIGALSLLLIFIFVGLNYAQDFPRLREWLKTHRQRNSFTSSTNNIPTSNISFGVQIDPKSAKLFCENLKEINANYTALWVKRNEIDKGNGNYYWGSVDDKINSLRKCGLKIAVHLQSLKGKDENFNMSTYMDFLKALSIHYKGKIERYSIENEAVAKALWPDSPESYFTLLDNAYSTIKQVDPDAIVEESGLSSVALGIMMSYDLYRSGRKEDALSLAQKFFSQSESLASKTPQNFSDLENIFNSSDGQRTINWLRILKQHQSSIDAIQIHFYGDWDTLQKTLMWLKNQGINKPIEIWEIAKHYPKNFDENIYAEETVKLLITAAGEGSQLTIYIRFFDWKEKDLPGLWSREGARPVATTFKIVAEKLNGCSNPSRLNLGEGVYGYKFNKNEKDIYVVWALNETKISIPLTGKVKITNVLGVVKEVDTDNLIVDVIPIFIERR